MSKNAKMICISIAALAGLFIGGCGAPRHGIAFSPDGKRMAYIDRHADGVILRNLETGAAESVYRAPDEAEVFGIFWPPDKDKVFLVEAKTSMCEKNTDYSEVSLKRLDPDSREKTALAGKKISCAESERMDIDTATGLFSVNFDPKSMSVAVGSFVLQAPKSEPSPFNLVKKFEKKEIPFNFVVSPDRKYIAYSAGVFTGAGKGKKADGANFRSRIKVLRVADKKVSTLTKQIDGDEFMYGEIAWSADGGALYYPAEAEGAKGIFRYEPATGRKTHLFREKTITFAPLAAGDKVFALFDRNESRLAGIVGADGALESVFGATKQIKGGLGSAEISPDGSLAAVLFSFDLGRHGAGILPILYNLNKKSEEMLVFNQRDNIIAGISYYQSARYDLAIPHLQKAGSDGLVVLYLSHYYLHNNEAAEDAYGKIIRSYEASGDDPHFKLGAEFEALEEYALAEREYLQAKEDNKGLAYYFIAELQNNIGNPSANTEKAISYYRKAIDAFRSKGCYESKPGCRPQMNYADAAPYELAVLYQYAGRDEEALNTFKSLKTDYPRTDAKKFVEIRSGMAALYAESGDFDRALTSLHEGLDYMLNKPRKWQKEYSEQIKDIRTEIDRTEKAARARKPKP